MSKFRVEFDGSFNSEEDAIAFFNLIETWKAKMFQGVGDEQIPIITNARYHECFHDEKPPKPCGNYVNIDFKAQDIFEYETSTGKVMVISADNKNAIEKK